MPCSLTTTSILIVGLLRRPGQSAIRSGSYMTLCELWSHTIFTDSLPSLLIAHTLQNCVRRSVVYATYHVGAALLEAMGFRLSRGPAGHGDVRNRLSTSLLERLHLTLRHALAPLVRKSWSFC